MTDRSGAGRSPATGRGGAHVVTLLTRPGCHLCEDAREVIARVAADLGVPWQERDITESDDDLRAYGEMTIAGTRRPYPFWSTAGGTT